MKQTAIVKRKSFLFDLWMLKIFTFFEKNKKQNW